MEKEDITAKMQKDPTGGYNSEKTRKLNVQGLRCFVCELVFVSKNTYDEHVESSEHKKWLELAYEFTCQLCHFRFVSELELAVHFRSDKHKRRQRFINRKNLIDHLLTCEKAHLENKKLKPVSQQNKGSLEFHCCEFCFLRTTEYTELEKHLQTKFHQKRKSIYQAGKQALKDQAETYSCGICHEACYTIEESEDHVASTQHLVNSQIYDFIQFGQMPDPDVIALISAASIARTSNTKLFATHKDLPETKSISSYSTAFHDRGNIFWWICKPCGKKMNSDEEYSKHINGKVHRKIMSSKNRKPYSCDEFWYKAPIEQKTLIVGPVLNAITEQKD